MTLKTTPFDSADYLDDGGPTVAAYLDAVFGDGDPALVAHALGVAARARGMTSIARDTALSRESLYRALSPDGNPELRTVMQIMRALGRRLAAVADEPAKPQPS